MHILTHIHSPLYTHTHTIMSTWLCMLSVWRSPPLLMLLSQPSESARSNIDWLTDWGKVQPSRSQGWRCTLMYACKCVSLSVFVHVHDCSGCLGVCRYMYQRYVCVPECENGWRRKKWKKMREGRRNHVGWIRHFCLKNGGLEGLMKTLVWTKRNC